MSGVSPYERALGERIGELHPTLRRYFASLPDRHVGRGEGVRIRLTVDAPLVGRIYEYGGTFRYRIEEES